MDKLFGLFKRRLGMNKLVLFIVGLAALYANAVIIPQTPKKDADGCYRITSAEELFGFADEVNAGRTDSVACAYLDDDITINENVLDSTEFSKALANREILEPILPAPECIKKGGSSCKFTKWTPIGSAFSDKGYAYEGTFDGRGHTIRGLVVYAPERDSVGFFGNVYWGRIQNLNIEDSYIQGKLAVGGIVGGLSGWMYNCSFSGVVAGERAVGGLGGTGGSYLLDHNLGYVRGSYGVGGVVGSSSTGRVAYSSNKGSVYGEQRVGGVAGYSEDMVHSYNVGFVYGSKDVAGLVGAVFTSDDTLMNSYSIGPVYCTSCRSKLGDPDYGGITFYHDDRYSMRLQYALKDSSYCGSCAERVDSAAVVDGTLVKLLNRYPFVSVWKQGESYPVFNEDVIAEIKDGMFQIKTESQLDWYWEFRGFYPHKGAILLNDLTYNENVLRSECVQNKERCDFHVWREATSNFTEIFDGNGHSISGLYGNRSHSNGMFYYIGSKAVVKNFVLEDSFFGDSANKVVYDTYYHEAHEVSGERFLDKVSYHHQDSIQYEYNDGLWFNGKRLRFNKRKYCYYRDSSNCYPDDNITFHVKYPKWMWTSEYNWIQMPYQTEPNPYSRFYENSNRSAGRVTMDSLGYIAYKYASWPTDTNGYIEVGMDAESYRTWEDKKPDEFCLTYTSDHDLQLSLLHCRISVPKSSKPKTVNIKLSEMKQYEPFGSNESVSCDSMLYKASPRFYFGHRDATKKIEGVTRIFELGPKGACKGDVKISEKEPDFCYHVDPKERNFCKEPVKESELGIAPKPVRVNFDVVHVGKALYFSGFSSEATYRIMDVKGGVVKSGRVQPAVGIAGLKTGAYAVLVRDGSRSLVKKILLR